MIRSFLFVPGDSDRKLEKSLGTDAHALIVDLEDAVAPENKEAARGLTRAFLDRPREGKQVYVRINAFDTGMVEQDLDAVMPGRPDGIMLPKSGGGEDMVKLGALLDTREKAHGIAVGSTRIIPVATETPEAVLNLASYRGSSPRLWGMLWGAEDLAGAIGATSNRANGLYRSPFRMARDQCLMAAAAAGVVAIDAVYVDVKDFEGLRREADEARSDGFAAKAAIYPAHCEIINATFCPTDEEVSWARAVLDALENAKGGGVATLNGKMVDRPHEVQARRILESIA